MGEDRLSEALNTVISNISDDKVIRTLQAVLALNDDINYMDWNDWNDYSNSEEFVGDMLAWFE